MDSPVSDEKTPLLGRGKPSRPHAIYILPYTLLLFLCFFSSFIPLMPTPPFLHDITSANPALSKLVPLFAPYAIQRICWPLLPPMLDSMVLLGLVLSDQAQERRLIRKSDSLSVVLKSLLLKVIPILTTIILAIKATRLPVWYSLLFGGVTQAAMGLATYFVFVPLARMTQARKASRDDKVETISSEAGEAQDHYIASIKTKARYRCAWQGFLFTGLGLIFLFLADEGNMVIWLRLGHQFLSIDETYDKFAQSYPKVTPILKAMRSGPGILHCLFLASEWVWMATPMPLNQVEWAWKIHGPPKTAIQPSPLQDRYASDAV